MTTTSVKVSELTGAALRYAVAVAAGYELDRRLPNSENEAFFAFGSADPEDHRVILLDGLDFEPDRDWSQCGPLIERLRIAVHPLIDGSWEGRYPGPSPILRNDFRADEALIAACRAIAASRWGEYADIPSELVQEQSDE